MTFIVQFTVSYFYCFFGECLDGVTVLTEKVGWWVARSRSGSVEGPWANHFSRRWGLTEGRGSPCSVLVLVSPLHPPNRPARGRRGRGHPTTALGRRGPSPRAREARGRGLRPAETPILGPAGKKADSSSLVVKTGKTEPELSYWARPGEGAAGRALDRRWDVRGQQDVAKGRLPPSQNTFQQDPTGCTTFGVPDGLSCISAAFPKPRA